MSEYKGCDRPEEHKAHMCQLKREGRMEEIDKNASAPRFVCNRCGAKANEEGFLCTPRPI